MARKSVQAVGLMVPLGCGLILAILFWAFKGRLMERYTKDKTSCYGARGPQSVCKTCDSVLAAYAEKGWTSDRTKIAQCKTPCYGARGADDCETCDDVLNAYKAKGWKLDKSKIAQCKK